MPRRWMCVPLVLLTLAGPWADALPAVADGTPSVAGTSATPEAPVLSSPFDVGGRNLFLRCIGSGGPTVILEAGYGDDGTIWAPVQLRLSASVRVCSYDRAGLSRSDPPDHRPRTAADVVADLHALLGAADVAPPYVLAGHSYGGLFTRLFAATYPAEVAGMVLVDAWHEDYDARLRALVSPEQWTEYEALLAQDPDYEAVDFEASYAELRAAPPLRPMPLVVLSHGRPPDPSCCPPGWPLAAQERLWQELQANLAGLVPNSHHLVVAESGHGIAQAEPEVVVAAIQSVVAAVRQPETWGAASVGAAGGSLAAALPAA
jgi:pimeloyl-ACP methyl ester carboxylesterase